MLYNNEAIPLSIASRNAGIILLTLGRVGVPLFLMLTGYLLLGRDYSAEGVRTFWRKKWLPLCICTVGWCAIWHFVYACLGVECPKPEVLLSETLLLNRITFVNAAWYLYEILGIYLLLPVMARGLSGLSPRDVAAPLGVSIVCFFLWSSCATVSPLIGGPTLSSAISFGFTGGRYGVYVLLGWVLYKGTLRRIRASWLIFCGVASTIILVGLQIWVFDIGPGFDLRYDSFLLLVTSVCCFELLSRVHTSLLRTVFLLVSTYSFGIYLIHKPIQFALATWAKSLPLMKPAASVVFAMTLLVISWFLVFVIAKVPKIGKRLFLLK